MVPNSVARQRGPREIVPGNEGRAGESQQQAEDVEARGPLPEDYHPHQDHEHGRARMAAFGALEREIPHAKSTAGWSPSSPRIVN
jgi:hypothetical protein